MKNWKWALAALLTAVLGISFLISFHDSRAQKPMDTPETPPAEEEIPVEKPSEPTTDNTQKEQAGLVDSNLMLRRLNENLLAPLSAVIRTGRDSSVKTEISSELLEEMAGFLCQNFTVLRYDAQVDLKNSIYMEVMGEKNVHEIYITPWTDAEGTDYTFVQVEESGVMSQFVYHPTTYHAMLEVLEGWEYENSMTLDGEYLPLTTQEYLYSIKEGRYAISHLQQYGNNLLFGLKDKQNENMTILEVIDATTGDTVQDIILSEEIMDVRSTQREGYDFCVLTEDSILYRSSNDVGLRLDFHIPQGIKEKLLQNVKQPLFDLHAVRDVLVYISEEGVVLSNQAGKRNDLLLPHERLYELLNLNTEENPSTAVKEQENLTPVYAAPQLMNNGKLVICPILLQGEIDRWAGFTIFNLMNGTYKDYISEFSDIQSFRCPDEQTLLVFGEESYERMDVLSREIIHKEWTHDIHEQVYLCGQSQLLTWRRTGSYQDELVIAPLDDLEAETVLLRTEGDNFRVYGAAKNYALIGWSDSQGEMMALVDCMPVTTAEP